MISSDTKDSQEKDPEWTFVGPLDSGLRQQGWHKKYLTDCHLTNTE